MINIRCKGLTLRNKQWVYGYYCLIEGKHYIIHDTAEYLNPVDFLPCIIESAITGFSEVDPKTVERQKKIKQ